ncbi:hypothetical protein RM780_07860 [Streptomyces sp. DSM 44917]|uniref:Uncharacterized protein n=1 Tax=Streptomyces boetiae TaxID=3075541 RepID=A0ABU2L6K3_9ACTN|nr:hypothetical protein [Streptomyces sp. DSM 44917]MDT0306878.1 hypothetical protein [Streptomyces sp. DSM 44917]
METSTPRPTPGLIVLYKLSADDVAQITQRIKDAEPRPFVNPLEAGAIVPAVVVRVWPVGSANLHVLLDGEITLWATSRSEGTEPGTWARPERG